MSFINVGAMNRDGIRYPSKKALKTALTESPSEVVFDRTSAFEEGADNICGDSLPAGDTLSVCGPDPYSNRRWYANVTLGPRGPKLS
jgi:hypothetical protein